MKQLRDWLVRWLLEPEIDAIYELLAAQQETIALLRERLHTMEAEIATLRDERQKNIGQIAGLELARTDLQRRLDTAYIRLKEAGMSVEGLT